MPSNRCVCSSAWCLAVDQCRKAWSGPERDADLHRMSRARTGRGADREYIELSQARRARNLVRENERIAERARDYSFAVESHVAHALGEWMNEVGQRHVVVDETFRWGEYQWGSPPPLVVLQDQP